MPDVHAQNGCNLCYTFSVFSTDVKHFMHFPHPVLMRIRCCPCSEPMWKFVMQFCLQCWWIICRAFSLFSTVNACQMLSMFSTVNACQMLSMFSTVNACQMLSMFRTMLSMCRTRAAFRTFSTDVPTWSGTLHSGILLQETRHAYSVFGSCNCNLCPCFGQWNQQFCTFF